MIGLAAFLALGAAAPAPLPQTLRPIEQCRGDASFNAFRRLLEQAVAKKDRAALLAMLAPDVLATFDGAIGPKVFEAEWSFDPSEYGNIWDLLEQLLKMGCARDGGSRIIPSLSMQVEQDHDQDWVVILPGAELYAMVGELAPRPDTAPWTVARITSRASDIMTGVRLPDGREGYIPDELVYEPTGYKLIIEQRGSAWLITAFVAGD